MLLSQIPDLNFSAEAEDLLGSQPLDDDDRDLLDAFLFEKRRRDAFWNSDVATPDSELDTIATEQEVTVDEVRGVLTDVLDPARREKRLFISALATIKDRSALVEILESKTDLEAEFGPIQFTEADLEPYDRQLVILFEEIFKEAVGGSDIAKFILRELLQNFGEIGGNANLTAWLQRSMLNHLSRTGKITDLQHIQAKGQLRANPDAFKAFLDQYLWGEGSDPKVIDAPAEGLE
ncbi:hypothetical protein KJ742_03935 [Patescibacteria group bacterium]|nr:hypothetical protein [Patescibacteria group bacterium]MBU1683073.1 hypothetical protein [Patescibacteria group bacterium]MBU1935166.1 hypothetical protein [Patescibacteria group bacterium]